MQTANGTFVLINLHVVEPAITYEVGLYANETTQEFLCVASAVRIVGNAETVARNIASIVPADYVRAYANNEYYCRYAGLQKFVQNIVKFCGQRSIFMQNIKSKPTPHIVHGNNNPFANGIGNKPQPGPLQTTQSGPQQITQPIPGNPMRRIIMTHEYAAQSKYLAVNGITYVVNYHRLTNTMSYFNGLIPITTFMCNWMEDLNVDDANKYLDTKKETLVSTKWARTRDGGVVIEYLCTDAVFDEEVAIFISSALNGKNWYNSAVITQFVEQPGGHFGGQHGGQHGGHFGGQHGGQFGGQFGGQPGGQPGGQFGGQLMTPEQSYEYHDQIAYSGNQHNVYH